MSDVVEETQEVVEEIEDLDISDIEFQGKNLEEWEDEFTIVLPSLPCHAQEVTQAIIDLHNKYQIAYNCYTKLMVLCSKSEQAYKHELDKLVIKKINALKASGVARMPSRENLEGMVADSKRLKELGERMFVYNAIKQFFGDNKTKLEKCMALAKDVSYSVNASDRMYGKTGGLADGL